MAPQKPTNFTPIFFDRSAGAGREFGGNSANNFGLAKNDPNKIQHLYAEKSSGFAGNSRDFGMRNQYQNAQLRTPSGKIHAVNIDWTKHETIMSDGSRIKFGQKLTAAESRFAGGGSEIPAAKPNYEATRADTTQNERINSATAQANKINDWKRAA